MTRRAILPAGRSRAAADQISLSRGVVSGKHLLVTGMTGSKPDGTMPVTLEEQFRQAVEKIGAVLREAGLDFGALVEMTTDHAGLRDHFDRFCAVRSNYVSGPYPAWTAVEVAVCGGRARPFRGVRQDAPEGALYVALPGEGERGMARGEVGRMPTP